MNKEIKFRAWIESKEEMIYEALEIKNIGLGKGSVLVDEQVQGGDELIWMQYTGLKDRLGKEIYEGDIVEFNYGVLGKFREEIKFIDGGFWIKRDDGTNYIPSVEYREIIGNIYEGLRSGKKLVN